MKWLKKWMFIGILLACGIVMLTATHSWAAVTAPAKKMELWVAQRTGELAKMKEDSGVPKDLAGGGNLQDPVQTLSGGEGASGGGGVPEGGSGGAETASSEENVAEGGNGGAETVPSGESAPETEETVPEPPEITYRNPEDVVYETVEDDYFADAVFIGDSRMVGMYEYGDLIDVSTFYVSKGLTIFKLFDAEIVETPDGGKISVEQALTENSFAKIYLEVGINEMGTGDLDRFLTKYEEVVNHLRELQPDAVIYMQGIMKVTTARSNKGDYINNEGIIARNDGIAALADNVHTYYLDVNPYVCDDTGGLNPDYTYDGVHLKGKDVLIWKNFLKERAVSLDGIL